MTNDINKTIAEIRQANPAGSLKSTTNQTNNQRGGREQTGTPIPRDSYRIPPNTQPVKYELTVYPDHIDVSGPISGITGYLAFREATIAAEKAILKEIYGTRSSE